MVGDNLVAVPEGSARVDDDFDAGCLGCLGDDVVTLPCIRIGVLLEDEMRDFPGFEELGEQSLGRFSEDKELGLGV